MPSPGIALTKGGPACKSAKSLKRKIALYGSRYFQSTSQISKTPLSPSRSGFTRRQFLTNAAGVGVIAGAPDIGDDGAMNFRAPGRFRIRPLSGIRAAPYAGGQWHMRGPFPRRQETGPGGCLKESTGEAAAALS